MPDFQLDADAHEERLRNARRRATMAAGEHLLVADDADAVAAAAVSLLRDPARARTLARAARALVGARYRWEESAAAVEAAWRDAVGARRAP